MLQPLGITAEAEVVYVALGPRDSASVADLARSTGLSGAPLDAALDELRSLGLACPSTAGGWSARPLLDVVDRLRVERFAELDRSVAAAEAIASRLLRPRSDPADGVSTLVGRESIVAAHDELCGSARRELCVFDRPPYVVDRRDVTEEALRTTPEWRALDRGVVHRRVYHPGFDADRLHEMALFAARGELSRTSPVPMKLIMVDASVAMVPSLRSYHPRHELRASVVRNPLLVEALVRLFEAVWDAAIPMLSTFTGQPDPRRQMLVSMLMSGSTDAVIAKTLGVTVRSVGRWVAELMDELGARTRLQLGAALVRAQPPSC